MVWRQILIEQEDAVRTQRTYLVIPDCEPGGPATDEETIYPDRIDQRHDRGVFDYTNPAPLEVEDLEAKKFGEEKDFLLRGDRRHRSSGDMNARASALISTMTDDLRGRNRFLPLREIQEFTRI